MPRTKKVKEVKLTRPDEKIFNAAKAKISAMRKKCKHKPYAEVIVTTHDPDGIHHLHQCSLCGSVVRHKGAP